MRNSGTEKKMFTSGSVFTAEYWREAALQLADVRMLCVAAVLIALRVALKSAKIPVGQDLNVQVGFFVNALGASVFGPVMAIVGAAISDTLGALIDPSGGVYFFPFIIPEIAGSLIFALMLWRQKLTGGRVILSRFLVTFISNLVLTPPIMIWYYAFLNNGKSYRLVTIPRIVKNLALFPMEALLLILFLEAMRVPLIKLNLVPKNQEKLIFTKKHIILLIALFVAAAAFVLLYYFLFLPNKGLFK